MRLSILLLAAALGGCATGRDAAPTPRSHPVSPSPFLGLRTAAYAVKDLAAAKAWYAQVFGVQPYFDQPFYVGFNVGGYELGLVPAEGELQPGGTGVTAYWGVEDIDGVYATLLAAGATALQPVQDVGDGIKTASVRDPFGNVLGVILNPHFKLP